METKDLLIRPSTAEDIPIFYQWELQPEVTKYFSINDNQSLDTVMRTYIHADDDPLQKQYTIVHKEDNNPIGRIVLADLIESWKVEILRIYIADPKLRGLGLGKQAMLAVIRLCFQDFSVERIYLDHYTGNPASYLYQSLGFRYEGILRKNCRKNGQLYDVHLMSILKEEAKEGLIDETH